MKIYSCEQRSEEWFELHIARCTASYLGDVMSFLKTGSKGPTAARNAYMAKKIAETLTGLIDRTGYVSPAMIWGQDHEDEAIRAYEVAKEVMTDRIGFAIHPEIERFGASPDRLIGDDGILEAKCPDTSTHIRWLLEGVVPEEHWPQMYGEMSCTGRDWGQFISFDPRLTKRYQLFMPPILKAETERILEVETHVRQFLSEMDAKIERLGELCPIFAEQQGGMSNEGLVKWGIADEDIRCADPTWTGTAV